MPGVDTLIGRKSVMLAKAEASYGVDPSPAADDACEFVNEAFGRAINYLQSNSIRKSRSIKSMLKGLEKGEWTAKFNLKPSGTTKVPPEFAAFITACMGGFDAGTGKHSLSDADLGSVAVYLYRDTYLFTYLGCAVNQMVFNAGVGEIPTFEFRGMLKTETDPVTGSVSPNFDDQDELVAHTGIITITGATQSAFDDVEIDSITFTLENGMKEKNVITSPKIVGVGEGTRRITGQLTAWFNNLDFYNAYINAENVYLEYTIGEGAGESLKIVMPKIKLTGETPKISDEGPIKLTVPFQALQNAADGDELQLFWL